MLNCTKFEYTFAKEMEGIRQPGSGAGEWEKLDVKTRYLLVDCKTNTKPTSSEITFTAKQMDNAMRKASTTGLLPALAGQLKTGSGVFLRAKDVLAWEKQIESSEDEIEQLTNELRKTRAEWQRSEAELDSLRIKYRKLKEKHSKK